MFVHLQQFATALIAQTAEQPAARGGCADNNVMFLPIVMMAILYFVWILPERKKQKAQLGMIDALKRGDEVLTAAGLFGTITDMTDKTFTLEIAKNVKIKVLKSAVSRKVDAKFEEKAEAKADAKSDSKTDAKSESKSKES